jgi:hypothetical protein
MPPHDRAEALMIFDSDTLNTALSMSLEWGPVRSTPLENRLAERFPNLTPREVKALKLTSAELESLAWREIERAYLKTITMDAAGETIRSAYPWVNTDNLSYLFTQGQYYAWHDNG